MLHKLGSRKITTMAYFRQIGILGERVEIFSGQALLVQIEDAVAPLES